MRTLRQIFRTLVRTLSGADQPQARPPQRVPQKPKAPQAPPPTVQPPEAEAAPCRATVRPELAAVNLRSGPGLAFPRIERAVGGMTFPLAGVSGSDADGHPWYWLTWDGGSGWVRDDLVLPSGECDALLAAPLPPEPEPPAPPEAADDLFPPPTPHRVTQRFHNAHSGYDLAAPVGTEIRAPAEGVVIWRVDCLHCTPEQPNIPPATLTPFERQQIFADPGWGFGFGNLITLRIEYARLPAPLQAEMDAQGLTGGFAYVLYAHLSRVDVSADEAVEAGTVLGATGNTGHASGPHLHFEVRVGRDERVEGRWLQQTAVQPALMFREGASGVNDA